MIKMNLVYWNNPLQLAAVSNETFSQTLVACKKITMNSYLGVSFSSLGVGLFKKSP